MKTEMPILNKIKSSRLLNEEEEIVQAGQLQKQARHTEARNRERKRTDKGGRPIVTTDDDGSIASIGTSNNRFTWIKETKPPTAAEQLQNAILACKEMISIIQHSITMGNDENGIDAEELKYYQQKLRTLLRQQIDECLADRNEQLRSSK